MSGRRRAVGLSLLLAGAIAVPIGLHARGGAPLIAVETRSGGAERVELHGPNRWEGWIHARGYDMPAHARLIRGSDAAVIATSPLFELSGAGPVRWTDQGVQIGSAGYDRATNRWTIEGE